MRKNKTNEEERFSWLKVGDGRRPEYKKKLSKSKREQMREARIEEGFLSGKSKPIANLQV